MRALRGQAVGARLLAVGYAPWNGLREELAVGPAVEFRIVVLALRGGALRRVEAGGWTPAVWVGLLVF